MPLDPFLFAHKVGPYHINIGGRWSPLSIRDQMLRGRWAVERGLAAGIVGGGRDLAVVGAGAGGVTAAMVAVDAGVATTLFDTESNPFSRHQTCRRWVDPTQYDWPLDHFPAGSIPWPSPLPPPPLPPVPLAPPVPPVPLSWPRANRAIALVGDWRAQFNAFRLTPNAATFLTWRPNTAVLNIAPGAAGTTSDVTWQPIGAAGPPTVSPFGLVITAMGFGEERSYVEYPPGHVPPLLPFRGYPFWSHDPFERPMLSWTPAPAPPRVLISGAGDGALQDFLRIVTRFKYARYLWDHLPLTTPQRLAVQKSGQDIEDQASRALAWSASPDIDHVVLGRLTTSYQQLAGQIYAIPGIPASLAAAIRGTFSSLWFVHPCDHIGAGYALNRLLTLLLIRHLNLTTPGFTHLPGYRLVDVACLHPAAAAPSPAACHWKLHRATFWPQPTCSPTPPPPRPLAVHPAQKVASFDVLVLRHGIQPPSLIWAPGSAASLPPTRQLLPYHHPS